MNHSGYLHPMYAQSLIEFGEPLELPASKGWILKRPILGTSHFDGMGSYPIFVCQDWPLLEKDLDQVGSQLVSLSLVTDPFGTYTHQDLQRYFKNVARPYKEHFVINLQRRPEEFVAAHHQRNTHKALKAVNVEVCIEPIKYLNEWVSLYHTLIGRHNIKGITKFSKDAFAKQLSTPGIVAFRAVVDDKAVGMLLWYVQGNVGYYHLGAYSPEGYKLNASFALFWTLLGYFADAGLKWLGLGAGAGIQGDEDDGLTRFKRGWATETRTVFFCGRIFDPQKYQEIIAARNIRNTSYFPAYRAGESW
jgi:Acetyltransferase (GNAT) domain